MSLVLVTGGAGYLGSHIVVRLLTEGYAVVIIDNFSSSRREVINRIEYITGKRPELVVGDISDIKLLRSVFRNLKIDSVVHCAWLSSDVDSGCQQNDCDRNSTLASAVLIEEIKVAGIKNIIFPSVPVSLPANHFNMYDYWWLFRAQHVHDLCKKNVEVILERESNAGNLAAVIIRCHHPVGAHESGLIGLPSIGDKNYSMRNGFNLRDCKDVRASSCVDNVTFLDECVGLIHVEDLASLHVAALNLNNIRNSALFIDLVLSTESIGDKELFDLANNSFPGDISGFDFYRCSIADSRYSMVIRADGIDDWKPRHSLERAFSDISRVLSSNLLGYLPINFPVIAKAGY